jgi:hypothetical protein
VQIQRGGTLIELTLTIVQMHPFAALDRLAGQSYGDTVFDYLLAWRDRL